MAVWLMFTSHVDNFFFFTKAKCNRYIVSRLYFRAAEKKNPATFGVAAMQSSYSTIVDQMLYIIS